MRLFNKGSKFKWFGIPLILLIIGLIGSGALLLLTVVGITQSVSSSSGNGNCQPSTISTGPVTLAGNGNAAQIWNFLTGPQAGFTPIAASGIEGNAMQESQLNPAEPGGGLFQWILDRYANLVAFARNNNADPNALSTQLQFLMVELHSGHHGSISTLNSSTSPAQAAQYFEETFEGAGIPMMQNRINYATGFYNQFAGKTTTISPTPVSTSSQPVITNQCDQIPGNASAQAQKVIQYAEQFLGVPYVWGGADPSGFDCSGLMMYSFKNALGIDLPRVAQDQQNVGDRIDPSQVQPGDLVFKGMPAYHVGMYIGNGKWIEAPQTGDVVKIANYDPSHFTTASRILK